MYKIICTMVIAASIISCKEVNKKSKETVASSTPDASFAGKTPKQVSENISSIYNFELKDIDGNAFNLSKYAGKKILIVNTASQCGYTPQYTDLQKLYTTYKDKLVVIGFPCNDFGGQEPGTTDEIKSFCSKTHGVTFPLTAKVKVNGDDADPIYKWLTQKAQNGVLDAIVKWNFGKFLIDEKGNLLSYFPSSTKPMDAEITSLL